jgi:predicted small lipoprotein YifL
MKPITRITTSVLAATLLASAFLTGCGRKDMPPEVATPSSNAITKEGQKKGETVTTWSVGECARVKGQERIGTVTGGNGKEGTLELIFVSDQVSIVSIPDQALEEVVCPTNPTPIVTKKPKI